jgi:hypothetical protein
VAEPSFRWVVAARTALTVNGMTALAVALALSIFSQRLDHLADERTWDGFVDALIDGRFWFVGTLQAVLLAPTAVVFLLWFAEAHNNARALVADTWRSTASAVGGWLIPIWVYWHGIKATNDLARASAADVPIEVDPRAWKLRRAPRRHWWWWIAFVISGLSIFNGVSGLFTVGEALAADVPLSNRQDVIDEALQAIQSLTTGEVALGIAGLVGASVVGNIARHQRIRLQGITQ